VEARLDWGSELEILESSVLVVGFLDPGQLLEVVAGVLETVVEVNFQV
jgi:hypothetical protein